MMEIVRNRRNGSTILDMLNSQIQSNLHDKMLIDAHYTVYSQTHNYLHI